MTGEIHFSSGLSMGERLIKEGVEVNKNQVENFKDVFWDPLKELAI